MHHSRSRPWSAKVAKLLPMVIILDVQTLPFDSEEVNLLMGHHTVGIHDITLAVITKRLHKAAGMFDAFH